MPEEHEAGSASAVPGDPKGAEVVRRLRSVEGHVRGITRMVEQDVYCMDVLNQVLAVQRALKKVSALILENHLQTCVASTLRGDTAAERERVIGEILGLFETAGRT